MGHLEKNGLHLEKSVILRKMDRTSKNGFNLKNGSRLKKMGHIWKN